MLFYENFCSHFPTCAGLLLFTQNSTLKGERPQGGKVGSLCSLFNRSEIRKCLRCIYIFFLGQRSDKTVACLLIKRKPAETMPWSALFPPPFRLLIKEMPHEKRSCHGSLDKVFADISGGGGNGEGKETTKRGWSLVDSQIQSQKTLTQRPCVGAGCVSFLTVV